MPQALALPQVAQRELLQDLRRRSRRRPAAHRRALRASSSPAAIPTSPLPPPALGRAHRRGPARRSATAPPRSPRCARPASYEATTLSAEERLKKASDWWSTGDHRHRARQDRDPRLSDPGADRHAPLSRHDLADAARRGARAGAGAPARGGAGRRRRPRPARAVDRDRAHGRHLRPAAERRDGVGDQRARRRPRRRRPAVHGAVQRDRRRRRRRARRAPTSSPRARPLHRRRTARSSPASAIAGTASIRARCACSRWCARPRRPASSAAASRASPRRRSGAAARARASPIPMNIDGATAVIYSELGFAPALGPRPLHPVALGRHPRPRLGADASRAAASRGRCRPSIPYRYTGPAPRTLDPEGKSHEATHLAPARQVPRGPRRRIPVRPLRPHQHRRPRRARRTRRSSSSTRATSRSRRTSPTATRAPSARPPSSCRTSARG